jgi:hypothetical protein
VGSTGTIMNFETVSQLPQDMNLIMKLLTLEDNLKDLEITPTGFCCKQG